MTGRLDRSALLDFAFPVACFVWVGMVPNSFVIPRIIVIAAAAVVAILWDRVPRAALVLLAVMAASAAHGILPWISVWGLPQQWAHGLMAAIIYAGLLACPTKQPWLRWLGVALSVHAVLQRFALDPLVNPAWLPAGRAVAYIGSPVDLGALLAMAAPVAGPWLPIVIAGLWACGSRAAWLAAAVALTPGRWRLLFLPAIMIPFLLKAPKDIARVELWRIAARSVYERPWLGSGPETYVITFRRLKTERLVKAVGPGYLQAHAHNDLLEAASTIGLLGLAAYLWLVIPFLRNPALLALFIVLKFDPVAFEVMAAGALIAANDWAARKNS